MREIRLANKIVSTLIKDRMHYTGRLFADMSMVLVRFGILILLYFYVFNLKGGEVGGLTFQVVAWSMFFYFLFSSLRLRMLFRDVMQDVRSGNIEVLFSKPISYLWYRAWWQIGSGLLSFMAVLFFGGLSMALFIGIPDTMQVGIFLPTLVLTFTGSILLSLAMYFIVGLFAFWVEDVNPIYWMVDKSVMILGGAFLPIALFPDIMQKIALYSPFGASQFMTHTVYNSWQNNWMYLVGMQIVWIVILFLLVFILFKRARKKVSVNGG